MTLLSKQIICRSQIRIRHIICLCIFLWPFQILPEIPLVFLYPSWLSHPAHHLPCSALPHFYLYRIVLYFSLAFPDSALLPAAGVLRISNDIWSFSNFRHVSNTFPAFDVNPVTFFFVFPVVRSSVSISSVSSTFATVCQTSKPHSHSYFHCVFLRFLPHFGQFTFVSVGFGFSGKSKVISPSSVSFRGASNFIPVFETNPDITSVFLFVRSCFKDCFLNFHACDFTNHKAAAVRVIPSVVLAYKSKRCHNYSPTAFRTYLHLSLFLVLHYQNQTDL